MLRLLDARTGSYAEVRPARRGVLRVCAHAPQPAFVYADRVLGLDLAREIGR